MRLCARTRLVKVGDEEDWYGDEDRPEELRSEIVEVRVDKLVATLQSGDIFGQTALQMSKPRNATILTLSATHFAVLNRRDFDEVLLFRCVSCFFACIPYHIVMVGP